MLFSRFIILYLLGFVGLLYSDPVFDRHERSHGGDVRRCEASIEMTPHSTIELPADSRPVRQRSKDTRTRSVFYRLKFRAVYLTLFTGPETPSSHWFWGGRKCLRESRTLGPNLAWRWSWPQRTDPSI